MFKRVSFSFKLIFACMLIAAGWAGASAYHIRSVQHVNELFINFTGNDLPRLDTLTNIRLEAGLLRSVPVEYQQQLLEGQKPSRPTSQKRLDLLIGQLRNNQSRYAQLARSDGHGATNAQLTRLDETTASFGSAAAAALRASTDTQAGRAAMLDANQKLDSAYDAAQKTLGAIITQEQHTIGAANEAVATAVTRLQVAIVVLAVVNMTIALGLGIIAAQWISGSLTRIRRGAEHIANGDFSHPIAVLSQDQLGQLATTFNRMSERLKEAYRRQAIAQQRDEAIILSMGEGLIAVGDDNRIALINKAACTLLELPDEASAIGKEAPMLYELYNLNDTTNKPLTVEERPTYRAMRSGQPMMGEYEIHRSDGTKHVLSIKANPVKLNGQVTGGVTVLRDVTKEREVDRMKTEFISLASHQLRTPLSAIKWFSEMLIGGDAGELKDEQLEFAHNISESTERMIDLVNALLNISRIESGRILVEPKPTDLRELVHSITNDLKAKIEEKGHSLVVSVHDDLPKINLDPRLIGQVYLNLLTNAIKYTPKGGEISVFVSRKDNEIISQITDNGYGIPEDQQSRLFQKFFRAANAVKVETDGTGLGLYLIKAIIESSGGKIWFKSAEGEGSTFWFSMPMSGMKAKAGEVTLDA